MTDLPLRDNDEGAALDHPSPQERILICDDEASSIGVLEEVLRNQGCSQIESLTDPRSVLARQAGFRPDLIVLGINMTSPHAYEVLEGLCEMSRSEFLPILVACESTSRSQAFEAGATDVITKPLESSEVICRVRSLLRVKQMYTALYDSKVSVEKQFQDRSAKLHDALDLLRKAEKELSRRLEESEAGSRAKTEFVGDIGHELRTPLNAILGFSEVIRDERFGSVGNPKYVQYAATIHEASTHLVRIVEDLLDLTRAEIGKLDVHMEVADATEVVDSSVRMLSGLATEAGIDLRVDFPDDFPPLRTDKQRLRQALVNIVTNALKFTPAGGSVTVKGCYEAERGAAILVISDTGVGIAEKAIPTALAPYGQVGPEGTKKAKGSGLGLPLTKRLVEAFGAEFELSSTVGKGTTVTFRFPPELVGSSGL